MHYALSTNRILQNGAVKGKNLYAIQKEHKQYHTLNQNIADVLVHLRGKSQKELTGDLTGQADKDRVPSYAIIPYMYTS